MNPPREDGGGREDGVSPTPPPTPPPSASPRVQLEVAFLDGDEAAPAPTPATALNERLHLTVLVVAAESDLRRYVRECLRERTDLRLLEAATVTAAIDLAAEYPAALLIVDEPESAVLVRLASLRAIVIVDDVPRGDPPSGARHRMLARPFSAEGLMADVRRLLGSAS